MKKVLSFIVVIALAIGFAVVGASKTEALSNFNTKRYGDVLDIGTYLRHLESDEEYRKKLDAEIKKLAEDVNFNETESGEEGGQEEYFTFNGGSKVWLGYDSFVGYYFKTFTLRSVGENVEVWVAEDLSYLDGRPTPVVTQEQVDKLRDEFDSVIYPTDTDFFGTPNSHLGDHDLLSAWGYVPPGYYLPDDGVERVIMLVDNIRDENFYDPSYPFFIAGFYSSTYEAYFDRNIINIDTQNWETRLESTFFGTTAHELQHLIHDDNDSMEETWINEGMSDFAEYLCGYGHPWGHVNFFLDHPENSLVEWDDHYAAETGPETLADYGQAYLLQLYLKDKFGQDFIRALAQDTDQGFTSVNKLLNQFETGIDFAELFRRFTIALAVDNNEPGNGMYNFDSIDLQVNFESALQYDKDGVPAWGGDYKEIKNANRIQSLLFDGIDFLATPWKVVSDPLGSGETVLWGNEGHELANQLVFKADLTNVTSATLNFDNYIDIEEHWDFGVVQVSLDNGQSWTSLENENTSYEIVPEGYPSIYDNLPGFTGHYTDWVNETFDLTPYVGQEILVNFNYMTDWGYNDTGWYIDNIEIPELGFFNDGSSLDDFYSINEIRGEYVEYAVTFINQKSLGKGKNEKNFRVLEVDPFNVTESESQMLRDFFEGGNNYMVIWYVAPDGTRGVVDYTYEITNRSDFVKKTKKKK